MRAMVFDGSSSKLQMRNLPVPQPGPAQVLIRIEACGVCRTDVHVVDEDILHPKLPLIPGHEIVGRIERLGSAVRDLSPGQRVGVPWLGYTCCECLYCKTAHENLCDKPRYKGYTVDGGFAENCVAVAEFVFPLEDNADPVALAPLL